MCTPWIILITLWVDSFLVNWDSFYRKAEDASGNNGTSKDQGERVWAVKNTSTRLELWLSRSRIMVGRFYDKGTSLIHRTCSEMNMEFGRRSRRDSRIPTKKHWARYKRAVDVKIRCLKDLCRAWNKSLKHQAWVIDCDWDRFWFI